MYYELTPYFENDVEISIVKYQFITPLHLNVKRPNGLIVLTGFGIGTIIEVIKPCVQSFLACRWEGRVKIPLIDGSILLNPNGKFAIVARKI